MSLNNTTQVRPGETPRPDPPQELTSPNGRKLSRLHLQKHLPNYGLVINCFADTPAELWQLYQEMLELIDQNDIESLAKAKSAGSPSRSARAERQQPRPAAQPSRGNGGATKPVCQECGSNEAMELISWKDKAKASSRKPGSASPAKSGAAKAHRGERIRHHAHTAYSLPKVLTIHKRNSSISSVTLSAAVQGR